VGLNLTPLVPGADRWRDVASCRDTSPDLFFPVGTTGPALDQIAEAKLVCDDCLVQQECLEFALLTNQDSGVWGGLSEEERRAIRKARREAARRAS
jgi:WhiB family transcriptional regulator, redox-sensing transcriptional regulator